MVYENFTGYSEVDPNNVLSQTATRASWTLMDRNYTCYISKSYDSGHFGNFEHDFDIHFSAIEAGDDDHRLMVVIYRLSPDVPSTDDNLTFYAQQNGADDTKYYMWFIQKDGGVDLWSEQSGLLDVGTTYYVTITRSGVLLRCIIYTDSDRTNVEWDSGNKSGTSDTYEYIIATRGYDYANDPDDWSTGYIENLNIHEAVEYYQTIVDSMGLLDSTPTRADFKQSITDKLGALDIVTSKWDAHVTISDILGLGDRLWTLRRLALGKDLPDHTIQGGA